MAMEAQKVFRIERRLSERDKGGAVEAHIPTVDSETMGEIRQLLHALDAKVSALPQLEEIEERLVKDVVDIQGRIKDTKEEIAALRHPKAKEDRIQRASLQLDAIVEQTEQATSTILESAERLEEQITQIRDSYPKDQLIANATDVMIDAITQIYEASNFQDITGQRTRKVVDVLKYIEERLGRMINLWGAGEFDELPVPEEHDIDRKDEHLVLHGPQLAAADSSNDDAAPGPAAGISQADIDALFD